MKKIFYYLNGKKGNLIFINIIIIIDFYCNIVLKCRLKQINA